MYKGILVIREKETDSRVPHCHAGIAYLGALIGLTLRGVGRFTAQTRARIPAGGTRSPVSPDFERGVQVDTPVGPSVSEHGLCLGLSPVKAGSRFESPPPHNWPHVH